VNLMDLAVIVVILLSAVLAFMRGLVSEVLSVTGWLGAALVTLFAFPHVQPLLRQQISSPMVADVAAVGGVFLATLVALTLISHEVAKFVRSSALSAVDRSLGFAFGLARGAVLVSVGYLLLTWLVPVAEQPDWVRDARTRPWVETGAHQLQRLVPQGLRDGAAAQAEQVRERAQDALQAEENLRRLTTPKPEDPRAASPGKTDPGYSRGERGNLDRLFQNNAQ